MESSPCCQTGSSSLLKRKSWNPYAVGAGIGVLSWLAFLVVNKPIGMSTEISKFSGWFASLFVGMERVTANGYWSGTKPSFGYETVFLLMTAVGALLSSKLSGTFSFEKVPAVWSAHHGPGVAKRMITAFLGGVIILYGARLAGGCTSGHGISGTLQLAVSSWVFFISMFASGIVTAALTFRNKTTRL